MLSSSFFSAIATEKSSKLLHKQATFGVRLRPSVDTNTVPYPNSSESGYCFQNSDFLADNPLHIAFG